MKKTIKTLTELSKLLSGEISYTKLYYNASGHEHIIDIQIIYGWKLSSILTSIELEQLAYE